MSDPSTGESDRREWTCRECGAELVYPDTRVLEHYDQSHGGDYGEMIGWYRGKETEDPS